MATSWSSNLRCVSLWSTPTISSTVWTTSWRWLRHSPPVRWSHRPRLGRRSRPPTTSRRSTPFQISQSLRWMKTTFWTKIRAVRGVQRGRRMIRVSTSWRGTTTEKHPGRDKERSLINLLSINHAHQNVRLPASGALIEGLTSDNLHWVLHTSRRQQRHLPLLPLVIALMPLKMFQRIIYLIVCKIACLWQW